MAERKSLFKKATGLISTALAVIIAVVCLVLLIQKAGNKLIFVGGKTYVYVVSNSMEPLIQTGSFIQVEKVKASDVKVGDIILFASDDPDIKDSFNTHQVLEIIGDHERFVTKGINNPEEDPYTAKADKIYGRYVKNAKLLNQITEWFTTTKGLFITLAGILAICLAVYLPGIIRGEKEDNTNSIKEALFKEELRRLQDSNGIPDLDKKTEE